MDHLFALLLGLMRRVRVVFVGLYVVVSIVFLYADPRAGWTWFIVVAGGALCLLFWWLVAFWTHVSINRPARDGDSGSDHG